MMQWKYVDKETKLDRLREAMLKLARMLSDNGYRNIAADIRKILK